MKQRRCVIRTILPGVHPRTDWELPSQKALRRLGKRKLPLITRFPSDYATHKSEITEFRVRKRLLEQVDLAQADYEAARTYFKHNP